MSRNMSVNLCVCYYIMSREICLLKCTQNVLKEVPSQFHQNASENLEDTVVLLVLSYFLGFLECCTVEEEHFHTKKAREWILFFSVDKSHFNMHWRKQQGVHRPSLIRFRSIWDTDFFVWKISIVEVELSCFFTKPEFEKSKKLTFLWKY